jgi:DNA-binding MarR family transcriptional regulator
MKQEVDDKRLIASVVLLERFVQDIYPAKQSSAIQPLQWSILRYLVRTPSDRCEVRWIAQFLGLTRAPVTRAIATLEARNMVSQQVSGVDARTKTVTLTEFGIRTLVQDPILLAVERIRILPKADQELFVRSVRSLALNLVSDANEQV